MLASINPLGERARHNRWGVTASFYVAGTLAGGAAMGLALGLAGRVLGAAGLPRGGPALVLAGAVGLAGIALDLSSRLPTVRRQVNEGWIGHYRGWVYGLAFGVQLGTGVVTVVTSAAIYAAWALALLSGSPWGGMVIGATFGLVRGTMILAVRSARDPMSLRRVMGRLQRGERWARSAAMASQGAVVAVAVGAVLAKWS